MGIWFTTNTDFQLVHIRPIRLALLTGQDKPPIGGSLKEDTLDR